MGEKMEYIEASNIKCAALTYAIKNLSGIDKNNAGFVTTNIDKLIEAARKIEAYLKENNNAN